MRPMLASPATVIPDGDDWIHEVKWDGMRVLADVRDGVLTLTSRIGNDVTVSFPELADLADAVRRHAPRRRGRRARGRASRRSARWPTGCTCATGARPSGWPRCDR